MRTLLLAILSLAALGAAFCPAIATAGKYNPTLSIGDKAPDWKDLPDVFGEKHSLAGLADYDVVVLCFTCNSCPYANDVEERLIALARGFNAEGKCALVAINANKVAEDLPPKMKERAEAKGYNFPYLFDETQATAKAYGATYTPEFVVLDKDRRVVYLGAFDDSADGKHVTQKYVADAVAAALAGKQPAIQEMPTKGCAVRYVRERRKRK